MITKHPWFGPKRVGWGLRPISWEGWTALLLCVVAVVALNTEFDKSTSVAIYGSLAAVAVLFGVALATRAPGE